jgi:hypothetical protein
MALSTISDLQFFVQWRDLLFRVNAGVGRLIFYRYGPLDLASIYQFWTFIAWLAWGRLFVQYLSGLQRARQWWFVLSPPSDVVCLLFHEILMLLLLQILIGYFNGCAHALALALHLKLKLWEKLSIYGLISIYVCSLPSEKYKTTSSKRKSLNISKICWKIIMC